MTDVQSLGVRLKAQQEKAARDKAEQDERQSQEALAAAQVKRAKVLRFFEDAKNMISDAILAGHPIPRIVLGRRGSMEVYDILEAFRWSGAALIENATHPYHQEWAAFKDWAQSNELNLSWRYEWDGGGVESWHTLQVTPL